QGRRPRGGQFHSAAGSVGGPHAGAIGRLHLRLHPPRRRGDAQLRRLGVRARGLRLDQLHPPRAEDPPTMSHALSAADRESTLRDVASKIPVRPSARKRQIWIACMAIGLLSFVFLLFTQPHRAWGAYAINALY